MNDYLARKATDTLKRVIISKHQDVADVQPKDGIFCFNCSGFIGWLLRDHLDAYIDFWPKSGERPYVKDYCDRIQELKTNPSPYWESIESVWDIRPGDIVSWKRPTQYGDRYPSGHVMIAVEPVSLSPRPNEVLLTVIDSTKQPHTDDSREVSKRTGLGHGVVGIGINEDGTPKSYFWRGALSTNEIITWVGAARMKTPTPPVFGV